MEKIKFEQFIKTTPQEIKALIEKSKNINQTLAYHNEGCVYNHIEITYEIALKTEDADLIISAIFHDLGKMECTKSHPTRPDVWTAYGHEYISTQILKRHREWIVEQGANYDNVFFIVENHMRMHLYNEMRKVKQDKLNVHSCFEKLAAFAKIDKMIANKEGALTSETHLE